MEDPVLSSGWFFQLFSKKIFLQKAFYKKKKKKSSEFPGSPVVKALPCNAGGDGLIPGRGAKHMPQGQKTKT